MQVHCSICRSPSELPKAAIGRRPMWRWMPTGFPSLSSLRTSFGSLTRTGLSPRISILVCAGGSHDLLRRDAVDTFCPGAHELDATAGDDERLEAVGAQVVEQLAHWLVNHLGEQTSRLGMLRLADPVAHEAAELLGRHPGMRDGDQFRDAGFAAGRESRQVAFQKRRERLLGRPFGMLGRQRLDAVRHEEDLEVDRLLGPERAVVVEGRNALGCGHEVGRSFAGYPLDELHDRLFCGRVIPGRQGIGGMRG